MAHRLTIKSGFREITIDPVKDSPTDTEGKWEATSLANGHSLYTSTDDTAGATVGWSGTETQGHSGMKAGSTVETWIDSNGKQHAIITRKL